MGAQEHSPVHYPADDGGGQGPLCSLDSNHSHFILVEPGPPGKGDAQMELWLRLEKHISEQRTGYGGEPPRGPLGSTAAGGGRAIQAQGTPHARASDPGPAEGELLARAVGALCVCGGGGHCSSVPSRPPWPQALAVGAGIWEENEVCKVRRHVATRGQRCPAGCPSK